MTGKAAEMGIRHSWFTSLTALINVSVLACTAFWLLNTKIIQTSVDLTPLIWLPLSFVAYLINRLFLKNDRSLLTLFVMNLFLVAIQTAAFLAVVSDLSAVSTTEISLIAVLMAGTTAFTVYSVVNPADTRRIRAFFEVSSLYFIFFLYMQSTIGFSQTYTIPVLLTVMLNLACMIYTRIEGEQSADDSTARKKGLIILFGSFTLICIALVIIMFFLSDPIGEAVVTLVNLIIAAVLFIVRIIGTFMTTLFPPPPPEPEKTETLDCDAPIPDAAVPDYSWAVILFGGLLAALALGFIIYFLYRLRYLRFRIGIGKLKKFKIFKTIANFWAALKKLAVDVAARVSLFAVSIFHRATPQGVYVSLERLGSYYRIPRRKGETQKHYLDRLIKSTEANGEKELPALLGKLQNDLQKRFYSNSSDEIITRQELIDLRRKMNTFFLKRIKNNITRKK